MLTCTLPCTGSYHVRVFRKAGTGNNVQCYNMTIYYEEGSAIEVAGGDVTGLATSVYPSPFASRTTVGFMAPAEGAYAVDVYDVSGRRSRSMEGYASGPGWVESVWDGRDQEGRQVSSGIYFIRVRLAGLVETNRVLVVR